MRHLIPGILVLFVLAPALCGCGQKTGDPEILAYLDKIEIQAPDAVARQCVIDALQDATTLSAEELKKATYYEPTGTRREWEIEKVFQKYFVPKDPLTVKVLHQKKFLERLKTPLVQDRLHEILKLTNK